jgi:DNA-directed RNA polymerase specialized sigma24 family protein
MRSEVSADSSEQDLFDLLVSPSSAGPEGDIISSTEIEALIAPLPDDDQGLVRMAIVDDVDMVVVAGRLGIPPGTARVRLHRALKRLRKHHIESNRRQMEDRAI